MVLRPPAALVDAALIWAALRFCTWAVVRLDNVVPPAATRLLIAEVEMLEMALVEIACRLAVGQIPQLLAGEGADRGGAQTGDGGGGDRAQEACAIQGGDDTGTGKLGGGELADLGGAQTAGSAGGGSADLGGAEVLYLSGGEAGQRGATGGDEVADRRGGDAGDGLGGNRLQVADGQIPQLLAGQSADRGGAQAGDGGGGDRAQEACAIQGVDDSGAAAGWR